MRPRASSMLIIITSRESPTESTIERMTHAAVAHLGDVEQPRLFQPDVDECAEVRELRTVPGRIVPTARSESFTMF